MNEHFDRHRARMTERERAAVWNRIREGGSRRSAWTSWKLWSPVAGGALAAVVLALVLIDKTPEWSPEQVGGAKQKAQQEQWIPPSASDAPRSTVEEERKGSLEKDGLSVADGKVSQGGAGSAVAVDRAQSEGNKERFADSGSPGTPVGAAAPIATAVPGNTPEPAKEDDRFRADQKASEPAASPVQRDVAESLAPEDAAGSRDASGEDLRQPGPTSSIGAAESEYLAPSALAVPETGAERSAIPRLGDIRREPAPALRGGPDNSGRATGESPTANKTLPDVEIVAERERIKTIRTATSHSMTNKDLESLPAKQVDDADALKSGVLSRDGALHFRGGRAEEAGGTSTEVLGFASGGTSTPNDAPYDAMFFRNYGANPLVLAEMDALSTFATDVDKGAYSITRRYIEGGHLPDRDSPRVEEFVNYFRGGYPEFYNPDFRILMDGAPSPFGDGFYLVRIGVKGRVIDPAQRNSANLVFVVDTSGSMKAENRLGLVQQSLRILVGQLRPDDRVGIVAYGSHAWVVLESTTVENRADIEGAIESLQSDGSTNAEEGLRLGYAMGRRHFRSGANNRILLCSDGVANMGRTGPDSILDEVRYEADQGIDLTTVGFGMGNYNDVLMERLADQGDGSYYYVDTLDEARRVFVENLTGTLQTIARDAKIQVEFDPAQVLGYRLLGFENRDVADQDFRNDAVDAGEIGAGHEVTALYEVRFQKNVRPGNGGRFATVRMRYEVPGVEIPRPSGWSLSAEKQGGTDSLPLRDRNAAPGGEETSQKKERVPLVQEIEQKLTLDQIATRVDRTNPRFRLAAVVAEFAEILRQSYWAKGSAIADLLPMAREVAGELSGDAEVAEFLRLVEKAQHLEDTMSPDERSDRERLAQDQKPIAPYFPPPDARE